MHPPPPPSHPPIPAHPPLPAYAPSPGTPAAASPTSPARYHYKPRRPPLWHSRTARAIGLISLLSLCGVIILAMVRQQTGTEGFLVGLGLAVFPVPVLLAAFCWLDRLEPEPWRNLAFAFAWGACAATLVAILANSFATNWLATNLSTLSPRDAETWGATVIAPVVEESVKAAAVLLLFLFRRRDFDGITDGIVIAGITATGFAFTENVLYIGNAFGQDQSLGHTGLDSLTAGTFFVRVIMSPFAHPLFTILTGLAFGIAATRYPARRPLRLALPFLGLLTAVLLHSIWNGASNLGDFGFLTVYGLIMVPVFAALTWLAIWTRHRELLSLRTYLLPYVATGWLLPHEPLALSSLKTRARARDIARHTHGPAAARAVTEYAALATSLAFLRRRAHRTGPTPDFPTREQSLLHHLWHHKPPTHPAFLHASFPTWPHCPPAPQVPPPGTSERHDR
ncbi:PrsW family intramembrane metalloprotease [Streptomyces sp. MST-110588]|uniref:PrsW family intramembrane metalloprotease n=1 Tax=Streptomyces sp. MST-110588 TaxID=2833628 RepID=UPI001F5D4C40|nr:PrsW family intramembrane metalloprotease [Streptomyces sp. MST-110588]UNO41196.1 PrsW family intramembrane metalloprotease [Streptomyces sp. MST-110588]